MNQKCAFDANALEAWVLNDAYGAIDRYFDENAAPQALQKPPNPLKTRQQKLPKKRILFSYKRSFTATFEVFNYIFLNEI